MNLNKNIVRNDRPVGFSWLISLVQGSLSASLAFLNLIVLSLVHGNINKEFKFNCQVDNNYPGDDVTIRNPGVFLSSSHGANLFVHCLSTVFCRSSVAFFITTTLPSVLWLSRSPKKGQNFNLQTVIGSGKAISSQDVAGAWGVCWGGAHLFHDYELPEEFDQLIKLYENEEYDKIEGFIESYNSK